MRKAKAAKRLSSLLVVFALLASIFPMGAVAASADKFTDISRNSWYYDAVDYVAEKGYFKGTSDTTFTPNGTMTRAMFVTALARMDGAELDDSTSVFDDVPVGTWYTGAVTWAEKNNIVNGYGNGLYDPNRAITREDMCVIMDRFIQYYGAKHNLTPEKNGSTEAFPDGDQVTAYASEAVANCRAYGLVEGYDDGCFHPKDKSTRSQVAAVIYRLAWLTIEATDNGNDDGVITRSSYTITYYRNDGTEDVFDSLTTARKSFTVTDDMPFYEGHTFVEWNTEANGTGTSYVAGRTYRITANLALYAIWEPEEVPTDPDDLVGNAVKETVDDANSKYETMKNAVINAVESSLREEQFAAVKDVIQAMVSVQTVTYDQNETGPRTVSAAVSASVTEGQAVSAIEAATEFAENLLSGVNDGTVSAPSMNDVESFLAVVKEAVEERTGIIITDQSLAHIKTQVVNRLMEEGKEEWAHFYGDGGYYCGDVTIEANDCTVVIRVDGTNMTTTLGSVTDMNGNSVATTKTNAVKYLGEAIAKDMLDQAREQSGGNYISSGSMTGTVIVTFAPSATAEYAEKQFTDGDAAAPIFPNVYEVSLTVDLDSDGLVAYKWADGENYLKLTVTEDLQSAYNGAVDEVAAEYANDPEVKTAVVEEIQVQLPDKVDSLVGTINGQLSDYGVALGDSDIASLKNALIGAAAGWVDTNWTALISSLTGEELNTNNTALADAAWPVIEAEIPSGEALDDMIQDQIERQLEAYEIDEEWIVGEANENSMLQTAQDLVSRFTGQITSDGEDVTESLKNSINVKNVTDINTLMSFGKIKFYGTLNYEGLSVPANGLPLQDNDGNDLDLGDYLKKEIVSLASGQLNTVLASHATLSQLLTANSDAKDYFMYSALVQLNVNFEAEKTKAAKDGATLTALRASIEEIAKEELNDVLDEQIKDINVDDALKDASDKLQAYEERINLLRSLKFSGSGGIQDQTFAGLAEKLEGEALQEIVGDRGNTFVEKYLAVYVGKLVNRLPAGARITINGVKFDKDDLSELSKAHTTVEALGDVANVIGKLGTLSINSFDDEGIPVKITYGARNFEFNLVIDVVDVE